MVSLDTVLQQAAASEATSNAINELIQKIKTDRPEISALIDELEDLHTQELTEVLGSAYRLTTQSALTLS